MNELRLGVAQLRSMVADEHTDPRPENLARLRSAVAELTRDGAQLVVAGETFLTGYASGAHGARYAVAERDDDPFVVELAALAGEHDVTLVVGAATHKGSFPGDLYNSALVVESSGLRGVYNKTHVPSFAMSDGTVVAEGAWWASGQQISCIDTRIARLGVEICYDIIYPETARCLTLQGADIIINVAAAVWGFESVWDSFLPVRATENAIPYLHVSLVGDQGPLECFGGSRLYSAAGQCIGELPRREEATGVFTVDLDATRMVRAGNHLFTMRAPSLYERISQPSGPIDGSRW